MSGKPVRDLKRKWHPAVGIVLATVVFLGSAWAVAARFSQTSVSSVEAERSPDSSDRPDASPSPTPAPSVPAVQASASPDATSIPGNQSTAVANRQGSLRISNPTEFPARVVLLAKKAATPVNYELPAHWDFAPQEGGAKGLLVSLPDRSIRVKKGDILVAFAQDGSRRYWGPYVVGETEMPRWNPKAKEWQFVLQP